MAVPPLFPPHFGDFPIDICERGVGTAIVRIFVDGFLKVGDRLFEIVKRLEPIMRKAFQEGLVASVLSVSLRAICFFSAAVNFTSSADTIFWVILSCKAKTFSIFPS